MANSGDTNSIFDMDDYYGCLYPFTPGKYYVADATGFVIGEYGSYGEAKADACEDDVVLIAVKPIGKDKEEKLLLPPKVETKCDKIVIDFDKKELTIGNKDVTIAGVEYEKDSVYDLEDEDLKDWQLLLSDSWKVADVVETLGTPPIDGKDITNEMSDL